MPNITCIDPHSSSAVFSYCPSYPASVAFSTIFALICAAHVTLAVLHRKNFCWVICMGALWETGGFIFRTFNIMHPTSENLDTISLLLILLSPLWVNAFAYMVLGRMAYYWLPEKKIGMFKARSLSKWFVWLDICSFIVQAIGGILLSSNDSNTMKLGKYIYMGGIGVQQAFILFFFSLAIKFHRDVQVIGNPRISSWKPILFALYACLVMISVRIIYRLVEFSSGFWAYIPTHEWVFYVFEAGPMTIAMVIFLIIHPGRILIGEESEFSKLKITKGERRWWCCGRRSRQKVDLDFEMDAVKAPRHEMEP